jgi:hypothetical protein
MIDLAQPTEHQHWQETNDNVMGGISQGQLTFHKQSSRFWGELSLENNGGFSSISRHIEPPPLGTGQIGLVFTGDGRQYQEGS